LGDGKVLRLMSGAGLSALCIVAMAGADTYSGRVVIELVDDIEFAHHFRLLEDFAFIDRSGKPWIALKGGIVDDEAVPRDLLGVPGLPYIAEYRKAALLHGYLCRTRTEPWQQVHRVLFDASLAEGLTEAQAKGLYAVVYAGSWRWETRTSTCYRSCHASSASLVWKPAATAAEIEPVLRWISQDLPDLDAIDRRLNQVVKRPGPHLFAQRP
jgi:Protein of unknown function (DUF1353)